MKGCAKKEKVSYSCWCCLHVRRLIMSDVEIEILYNYYLGEIVTKLDEI